MINYIIFTKRLWAVFSQSDVSRLTPVAAANTDQTNLLNFLER
jgi:hypothetical protein